MKKLLSVILLAVVLSPLYAQRPPPFKGCAPEGNGKPTKKNPTGKLPPAKEELNLLKNRDKAPILLDHTVTLARIMKRSEDRKFKNTEGAQIVGFVAKVKAGEPRETCNCARDDIADIHIDVVLKEADKKKSFKYMIVEISPRFQDQLGDLASVKAAIEGQWVKFTGWMMNDVVHRSNAKNTNPKGKAIWRATSWEIHPVTAFKIVPAP
jgi:hypothetical protein